MKDITIQDLTDLVIADVPEADNRIERMFEWHYSRDLLITKWVLGIAASFTIAILIAIFKAEVALGWWQAVVIAIIPLGVSSYGFYRLRRSRLIHRQFIVALAIYNRLKSVRQFLAISRREYPNA